MSGQVVGTISIKVTPDTTRFRRELHAELEEIEKQEKAKVGVDLDMKTAGAQEHLRVALAEMKAKTAAANLTAKLDLDTRGLTGGVRTSAAELEKLSGLVSSAGGGFSGADGIGRTGLLIGAVFAAAAPAVGLVSGLLAGIPSLLSAIAVPIGAVAVGMDGIKKAAEDAGLIGTKGKGDKKAQLGAALADLKAQVSNSFTTGLTPVFQQVTRLIPEMTSGLSGMASQLSGVAKGVVDVLTSSGGMAQIATIFGKVGDFVGSMTPAMESFTKTFLTLGADGAKNLGLLAAPMQTFANSFDQMIGRVSQSGALQKAFGGLSQVLGSLGDGFTKLFESGLTAMGQLGGPISSVVRGLLDTFVATMPALTGFSGAILNVVGSLGSAIAPALQAISVPLQNVFNTLGNVVSSNIATLGPVITQIGTALGTGLQTALTAIQPLLPGLMQTFQQLAGALSEKLAAVLPQLATSFGQLAGAVMQIAPTVLESVAQAFTAMAPALPNLAAALPPLATAFAGFLTSVTPLIPQLSALAAQFVGMLPSLTPIAGAAMGVVGALSSLASGALAAASAVAQFASGVVTTVSALGGQIKSAVSGFGTLLVESGKALIQGLINGIQSAVGGAIAAAKGIADKVAGAVKGALGIHSPSRVFMELGQFTAQGFQTGLENGFQGVIASANALANQLQTTMSTGMIPAGLRDNVKQELQAISQEYAQLRLDRDQLDPKDKTGRKAIADQMRELQTMRDRLKLGTEQLGPLGTGGPSSDSMSTAAHLLTSSLAKGLDAAKGFAMTNVSQFEQDLGISGQGAIPQIANWGLNWASTLANQGINSAFGQGPKGQGDVNIHVNSVDEAMAAKQAEMNRRAMTYAGR